MVYNGKSIKMDDLGVSLVSWILPGSSVGEETGDLEQTEGIGLGAESLWSLFPRETVYWLQFFIADMFPGV